MYKRTRFKKGPGAPTKYKEDYVRQAYVACSEGGLTDVKLAKLFNVCEASITLWKRVYPEFSVAIKKGRDYWDSGHVEKSLLQRAMGFSYDEVVKIPGKDGKPITTKIVTKHVAPETTAQIFWLKNRQPRRWRDKQEMELSGDQDKPIIQKLEIEFVKAKPRE